MAQSETERAQTLGEKRVRASFNPSNNDLVDEIKAKSAALIDLCDRAHQARPVGETGRLWAMAQTCYETGAMWAVKAATA